MSSVLGVIFAILVGMLSLASLQSWQTQAKNNVNAADVAGQGRQMIQAAKQYIQTDAITLQAAASDSTPVTVTVAQLQAAGLLPEVFKATNLYNQTWQLEVLQPAAGHLQGLVITTGGEEISDMQAMRIAKLTGYEGGFFPKNDSGLYPGAASNAYGANWGPLSASGYTAQTGHLALLINFNDGQLDDNRLYRNEIPGQPQLNTMTTPIIMASEQIADTSCIPLGAFARDENGLVVSCVLTPTGNLMWKKAGSWYWLDPVATYGALPAGDPVGSVRMTTDTGRAFMWTGASWTPLAADQNGNFTVPGSITAKTLRSTLAVMPDTSCAGYQGGEMAQNVANPGQILSCQSGVWKSALGGAGLWWQQCITTTEPHVLLQTHPSFVCNITGYKPFDGVHTTNITIYTCCSS